ncbi:hypothetical protein FLAG1_10113 [Fusarium langsethiae]|uniref:T6SS Phospholipase effector Tle1-like catalytic domain-containing protein n=1 Tax=Fusarium langsethiae TaxID=179993 RepID=A0A0N0DBQ3_FUSLA|nr:hypothetical protein FLAG1_10113 [Fusarium langsethiae]GKU07189.1 unnamed protein product [Fusarium langsethiae]GKU22510.1 unnamed protein product [Fusarium langsethiae]
MSSVPPASYSRLLWLSLDGTLASGLGSSRDTFVSVLPYLVSQSENVVQVNLLGPGSGFTPFDRIFGGAWAARYLAQIISVLGLPERGDNRFFHLLDKHCDKDPRFQSPVGPELLEYDTTIPLSPGTKESGHCLYSGKDWVLQLSALLFMTDTGPSEDVKNSFHCLALHEEREPFSPTYMCGENVHQVFFVGNHGDMGWIDRRKESFVHAPLAWVIQQLHWHSSIQFDEKKLKEYFPSYGRAPDAHLPCINGPVTRTNRGILALMGRKVCKPWKDLVKCMPTSDNIESTYNATSSDTELPIVQIHTSARYYKQPDAVPSYIQNNLHEGRFHWVRQGCEPQSQGRSFVGTPRRSSSSRSSRMKTSPHSVINSKRLECVPVSEFTDSHGEKSHIIHEAPVGALEAKCLGLSDSAVSAWPCCGKQPEEMPAGPPKEDPVPARGRRTRRAITRLAQSVGFSRS